MKQLKQSFPDRKARIQPLRTGGCVMAAARLLLLVLALAAAVPLCDSSTSALSSAPRDAPDSTSSASRASSIDFGKSSRKVKHGPQASHDRKGQPCHLTSQASFLSAPPPAPASRARHHAHDLAFCAAVRRREHQQRADQGPALRRWLAAFPVRPVRPASGGRPALPPATAAPGVGRTDRLHEAPH